MNTTSNRTFCDICEERVGRDDLILLDDDFVCPECAALTPKQRADIVRGWIDRHIAKMRSVGRVSLFEALAPRKEDFR